MGAGPILTTRSLRLDSPLFGVEAKHRDGQFGIQGNDATDSIGKYDRDRTWGPYLGTVLGEVLAHVRGEIDLPCRIVDDPTADTKLALGEDPMLRGA